MLTSGRYKGNPMMQHLRHGARIRPEHFDRWLALWDTATAEMMSPEHAETLQAKARRIGETLRFVLGHAAPSRHAAE
jgi:hemoglobin